MMDDLYAVWNDDDGQNVFRSINWFEFTACIWQQIHNSKGFFFFPIDAPILHARFDNKQKSRRDLPYQSSIFDLKNPWLRQCNKEGEVKSCGYYRIAFFLGKTTVMHFRCGLNFVFSKKKMFKNWFSSMHKIVYPWFFSFYVQGSNALHVLC